MTEYAHLEGGYQWGQEEQTEVEVPDHLLGSVATPMFLHGESQGWGAWWAPSMGSHRVGHD